MEIKTLSAHLQARAPKAPQVPQDDDNGEWTTVKSRRSKKPKDNNPPKPQKRSRSPKVDVTSCSAAKLTQRRRDQIKSGLTNRARDAEGNVIRVPLHKAPELTGPRKRFPGGNTPSGPPPPQVPSKRVFTEAPAATSAKKDENQEKTKISYAQATTSGTTNYFLTVVRKDKGPFTRGDQWHVQFAVSDAMVKANKEGKTGDQVAHSGTKINTREMHVFCTNMSGPFYKAEINKLPGYEAFLPEDKRPGHEIYASVPRVAQPILGNLTEHFVAGTFGAVTKDQVTISRKPWFTDSSNIHLYLEVDDKAFEWLKTKSWFSALGLFQLRWQHPPVKGLKGYLAPDQDPQEIKKRLMEEARPEREEQSVPQAQVDKEISLSDVEKDMPSELKDFHPELTELQEQELFEENGMNRTVIHRTPTKDTKSRRVARDDGSVMSDPSDNQ